VKHKYRISVSFSAKVEAESEIQAISSVINSLWPFEGVQNLSTRARVIEQIPDSRAIEEAPFADQVRVEPEV
jgi:hypothetical protein